MTSFTLCIIKFTICRITVSSEIRFEKADLPTMIVTVSNLIYDAITGIRNAEGNLRTFPYVQFLTDIRTIQFSVEVLRNEIPVGDYIQFLESRYDDSYDSWFESSIIQSHIETLKYTNILPSLDERQNTVLDILLVSIENMKKLMYSPKKYYITAEAYHIIHLPQMLIENSGLAEYYLYIDKPIYTDNAKKRNIRYFEKLWKRMEKSMGDALNGVNHTMGVFEDAFDRINNGIQTLDVKIYDDKRRSIKIGDTITMYNLSDIDSTITVIVRDILRFDTFAQAYQYEQNMRLFGGELTDNIDTMLKKIYRIYSQNEEIKYGVAVFRIELLEDID